MRTFGLHKNMVFSWNEQVYKIERINSDDSVLIERVNDGQMSVVPQSLLLNEYVEGKLEGNPESVYINQRIEKVFSRPLDTLPEKIKLEAKRRKHYINAIFRDGSPTFSPKYLSPLISEAAKEIEDKKPPHVITIYRWYRKYLNSQDTRSLIPRMDLRGSRLRKQHPIIYKLLAEVIVEKYKQSPQSKKVAIYDELKWQLEQENTKLFKQEQIPIPSKRTVERLISSIEVYDLLYLKEGKHAAEKLFRLVKNKVVTTHILERVEIDHTPLDLFLIDENTYLPLGRPTLTIIIDHFSRMILGYYISYQNPSTAAVMGALRHAILPKRVTHKSLPELTQEYEWVCYGVPELMVLDNGLEFHSDALESVAFDLGINMQFCPKHEPRFKGTVERFLQTFNYSFASQLPGASFARWHLRGDYDPQKHAVLTLGEFTQLFEKWVLDIYAQSKHRGINTTPWAKWHEGLKLHQIKLPMSLKELQVRIGKVDSRSLRRDGILIKGIRYHSDVLGNILRAYGEGVRVRVLYDQQDLGEIQVWAPDSEAPITVEALDQTYARGLTEQQNEFIRTNSREQGDRSVDEKKLLNAKHGISHQIQKLLESRHLKERKKGGRLSGVSSTNPKGTLLESKDVKNQSAIQKVKTSRPKSKPQSKDQPYQMPEILPTFQLNTKGGSK